MPLYEYECLPNRHRFEARQSFKDEPLTSCEVCGGEVRRVLQPVGIVFKGGGFYATDSRSSSKAAKPAEAKNETAPETKSETKSESKSSSTSETTSASGAPAAKS